MTKIYILFISCLLLIGCTSFGTKTDGGMMTVTTVTKTPVIDKETKKPILDEQGQKVVEIKEETVQVEQPQNPKEPTTLKKQPDGIVEIELPGSDVEAGIPDPPPPTQKALGHIMYIAAGAVVIGAVLGVVFKDIKLGGGIMLAGVGLMAVSAGISAAAFEIGLALILGLVAAMVVIGILGWNHYKTKKRTAQTEKGIDSLRQKDPETFEKLKPHLEANQDESVKEEIRKRK